MNPTKLAVLPVYLQISEVLIREIAAGHLVDGQRLPPEKQLAKQYQITVSTLRKALLELEKKGLLIRVHGSGNYIKACAQIDSVYSMFRLELHHGGGLPSADVIDIEEVEKPRGMVKFGTSHSATRIRRLRFLDKLPVAIEEIWLDRDAGQVDKDKISESLYRYYKMYLGFWIDQVEDRVSIAEVPTWALAELGKKPTEMVGFVERFGTAGDLGTIEYSRTWFNTDRAFYVQRLQ
ncbi:MAG: GntR family transcriptional regulator [Gammaproteobacteria bacterium]|jgi:GntR family transcriptional regulator|nr:GntR family transcriptional regulator [Gammaproteobacteria bacterium]